MWNRLNVRAQLEVPEEGWKSGVCAGVQLELMRLKA